MFNGKQIREKRESLKLSAPKLAKMLGTTKENIYKWEGGTVPRSLEDLTNIENWIKNGTGPDKGNVIKLNQVAPSSNGIDWKTKYYDLLEEHVALLRKIAT